MIVLAGLIATFLISSAFVTTGNDYTSIYSPSGDNLYSVTVSITITHVYYDLNTGNKAFENSSTGSQTFQICAKNPDQAKSEAKSECSSVCSRSSGRDLGKKSVNGKYYRVYEYREVYDANAIVIGTC